MRATVLFAFAAILTVLVFAGCTASNSDLTQMAKNLPALKGVLAQYPNAEIKVALLSANQIQAMQDTLLAQCNMTLADKDHYRVNLNDSDTNTKMVLYVETDTQKMVCAYKEGTPQTNTQRGSLNVTVYAYGTNAPVGGVELIVCKDNGSSQCNESTVASIPGSTVTTNNYGQAGFNLEYGTYLLTVVRPGQDHNQLYGPFIINAPSLDQNFFVIANQPVTVQRGSLNITVWSYSTNAGVSGADVVVCKDAHNSTQICNEQAVSGIPGSVVTTNAYGQAGFNLEYGDYLVRVIYGDNNTFFSNVTINSPSFDMNANLVTSQPQPVQRGTLNVTVYGYGTNAPVSGVTLIVCKDHHTGECNENVAASDFGSTIGAVVTTGVSGQLGFNLEYDDYLVTVVRPDHNQLYGPFHIISPSLDQNFWVVADQPVTLPNGSLNIVVRSYTTNDFVSGAKLIVCKDLHQYGQVCNEDAVADIPGSVVITNAYGQGGFNLEYGDYLVRVTYGDNNTFLSNVTINSPNFDMNANLVTSPVTQRGSLNITVYGYGTNAPVSGVELLVCKDHNTGVCNENVITTDYGSTVGSIVTTGVAGQAGFNLEYGRYLVTVVRPSQDHNQLYGPFIINSSEYDQNFWVIAQ